VVKRQHTSGMPALRTAWSCKSNSQLHAVHNAGIPDMLPHNHNGSLTYLVNLNLVTSTRK